MASRRKWSSPYAKSIRDEDEELAELMDAIALVRQRECKDRRAERVRELRSEASASRSARTHVLRSPLPPSASAIDVIRHREQEAIAHRQAEARARLTEGGGGIGQASVASSRSTAHIASPRGVGTSASSADRLITGGGGIGQASVASSRSTARTASPQFVDAKPAYALSADRFTRPSPPFSANDPLCHGVEMVGNNGAMFRSTPYQRNGETVYAWRRI